MKSVVFGLKGIDLSEEERQFFREVQPAGFILFNRNVRCRDQLRALTDSLRDLLGRDSLPILIDQEGGRVQMLRRGPQGLMGDLAELVGRNDNPEFPEFPAPRRFGSAHKIDSDAAVRAASANARVLGALLQQVGINVDCTPVLDLPQPGAHDVIGDRAFSSDPEIVIALGRVVLDGLASAGVAGVLKHVPGHGRAVADSHRELPRVRESTDTLIRHDLAPFKALADASWAMSAHIVYESIDPDRPATQSKDVIGRLIRAECGFGGILVTDALEMHALHGSMAARARAALEAGCDLALCCSGDLAAMRSVAEVVPAATASLAARLEASIPAGGEALDQSVITALMRERDVILERLAP